MTISETRTLFFSLGGAPELYDYIVFAFLAPIIGKPLRLDLAVTDFDRLQRLTIAYLWAIPGSRREWSKPVLGGW